MSDDGAAPLRGVLFDVDGTLLDTNYLHVLCWAEAFAQHGFHIPSACIHHAVGMGAHEMMGALLGRGHDPSLDEPLKKAHTTLYAQHWGHLQPLPRAAELIRACARAGLTVMLATSAREDELKALRAALDADDAITDAVSASEAEAGKPDPDILQTALDKGRLSVEEAVLVGDTVWDGRAAQRIGLPFIGLLSGGISQYELRDAGAREIYRDPAQLLESMENSALSTTLSTTRADPLVQTGAHQ